MSEMVERVAKAIKSALSRGTPGRDPERMQDVARAAIEAMREPTQGIVDCRDAFMSAETAKAMWRTMIDVASGRMK